jgi:hypothetical protein
LKKPLALEVISRLARIEISTLELRNRAMAMVCPQCRVAHVQKLACPTCGSRLQYVLMELSSLRYRRPNFSTWRQTPWGRLFVGIALALGMNHVVGDFLIAGKLIAVEREQVAIVSAMDSMVRMHGLQIFSVFLAGLLTGAGQKRGAFYGVFVALWSCLLFQCLDGGPFVLDDLAARAAQFLLLGSCGAAGGLAGSVAWQSKKPIAAYSRPKSDFKRTRPRRSAYEGPVAWLRVCMGIPIAVGGVVCAQVLREMLLDAGNGKLVIESYFQADFVAWEISALAILAGSAFAGATCSNGLKQGLFVGIGTATALLGIRLASPQISAGLLAVTVVAAVCLSITGGWFGGRLLPPVVRAARHRRVYSTVYT